MTYTFEIKPGLIEKLRRVQKRDPIMFRRVRKKISEIVENPRHYKPLKHGMRGIRRAHIGPFVLTFTINEKAKIINFLDFAHHDEIYL